MFTSWTRFFINYWEVKASKSTLPPIKGQWYATKHNHSHSNQQVRSLRSSFTNHSITSFNCLPTRTVHNLRSFVPLSLSRYLRKCANPPAIICFTSVWLDPRCLHDCMPPYTTIDKSFSLQPTLTGISPSAMVCRSGKSLYPLAKGAIGQDWLGFLDKAL